MKKLWAFLKNEEGTETVEWALVGGLIVAVGAAIFAVIGTDAASGLQALQDETAALQGTAN